MAVASNRRFLGTRAQTVAVLFVLILREVVQAAPFISTFDLLRDTPSMSADFVARQNDRCETARICGLADMRALPVCATDGRTYNSRCEIKRARCHGNPIDKQLDGPCPEKSKCRLERKFQQDIALKRNDSNAFVPECEGSGDYSTVQCHANTGYCWCVTRTGRPLPGTSVRYKRPSCVPYGKFTRRSSSSALGRRKRGGCSTVDRSTFNANMLQLFRTEYRRIHARQAHRKHRDTKDNSDLEKRMIGWKFDQLDRNGDKRLSRRELRGLKRLVRKLVQPRGCARRFTKYCDLDHNLKIDQKEWLTCMGVDINRIAIQYIQGLSPNKKPQPHDDEDSEDTSQSGTEKTAKSGGGGLVVALQDGNPPTAAGSTLTDDVDAKECRGARARALRGDNEPYVPRCLADDDTQWAKVQCHESVDFQQCWCAEPATGKPVPGTAVSKSAHAPPDCDRRRRTPGPIKKCPPKKRARFYKRLLSTMSAGLIAGGGIDRYSERVSRNEVAVRWKFEQLDVNRNKRLERREWKHYRKEIKMWKGVRKCGRNFLRYCDGNRDKKITLDEWLFCTLESLASSSTIRREPETRRRGNNPFETILRSDK